MTSDKISPWMPEQDRILLATLAKLIEELNEMGARAARCISQGIHEVDPDTGRTNHAELEREMADVEACLTVLSEVADVGLMLDRSERKAGGFRHWHRLIRQRERLAAGQISQTEPVTPKSSIGDQP